MCTYCGTKKYRKIYQNHYGPIPKEDDGRTYEIHHIDGNHYNNDPSNLKAVTIKEHYDIHYAQSDWTACLLISRSMRVDPKEKSKLASLNSKKMLKEGNHPFLSKSADIVTRQRVKDGTFHLLKRADGTSLASDRVKAGTHHFLGGKQHQKVMEKGIHPSQVSWSCLCCKTTGKGMSNYNQHHGINCKKEKAGIAPAFNT